MSEVVPVKVSINSLNGICYLNPGEIASPGSSELGSSSPNFVAEDISVPRKRRRSNTDGSRLVVMGIMRSWCVFVLAASTRICINVYDQEGFLGF